MAFVGPQEGWSEAVATVEAAHSAVMEARLLTESELSLWDGLVGESPYASIFDESRWLLAVSQAMEQPVDIVGVFDGAHLLGGVAFTVSRRCGIAVATLPPLCPSNPCIIAPRGAASRGKQERHVLRITESLASYLRSSFRCAVVTNSPAMTDIRSFRWEGFLTNVLYTHRVDLQSIELSQLSKSRRRAIRKAAKANVVADGDPDPDTLHALLEKTARRHGFRPPVSAAQLVRICNSVGEHLWCAVARLGDTGVPLAGYLSVIDEARGVAYGLFAGFDDEYAHTHASSFLGWHEIMMHKERGLKTLDLGGADVKENAEFKYDFEGQLTPNYEVSYSSLGYRLSQLAWRMARRLLLLGG